MDAVAVHRFVQCSTASSSGQGCPVTQRARYTRACEYHIGSQKRRRRAESSFVST
jgi:hypothetical protein